MFSRIGSLAGPKPDLGSARARRYSLSPLALLPGDPSSHAQAPQEAPDQRIGVGSTDADLSRRKSLEVGHTFWEGLKQSGLIEVRPAEDEPQVLELMDKLAIKSRKRVVAAGDTWYQRGQPLPPELMPEAVTA